VAATLLGCWQLGLALRFHRRPDNRSARAVFLASLAYLPPILTLLVAGA
jgi:heme O synthase-like polyprenyltransferase